MLYMLKCCAVLRVLIIGAFACCQKRRSRIDFLVSLLGNTMVEKLTEDTVN